MVVSELRWYTAEIEGTKTIRKQNRQQRDSSNTATTRKHTIGKDIKQVMREAVSS